MAKKRLAIKAISLLALLSIIVGVKCYIGSLPIRLGSNLNSPHPMSTWPWQGAVKDILYPGVTHWYAYCHFDGTTLDLFEFDFGSNPRLRLELYDQDEDDDVPFDNKANYWHRGIGHVICHLSRNERGRIVAVWNGSFFGYDRKRKLAWHVAPIVLNGKVHYSNVGNYRWTFGVKYEGKKPTFKAFHLPSSETLAKEFTFAVAGVQCLIRDGKPLKLRPLHEPIGAMRQPITSSPDEAGHIPTVDHIKTSRTSVGWSRDNRKLYLLVVKEPDREAVSALALKFQVPLMGGWNLADLQRFWLAMKVWGAVNLDGGDVTQMAFLTKDGQYEIVPPRWSSAKMRLKIVPCLDSKPQGGTLMYFYVADVAE